MWVVGKVQTSPNVILTTCMVDSREDVNQDFCYAFNEVIARIKDNKDSLGFLQTASDPVSTFKFFMNNLGRPEWPYSVVLYYEDTKDWPVGVLLFSKGSPWYSDALVYNEECSVAFKRGLGLATANYLTLKYLMPKKADLIQLSCANPPCAKMLENTYSRLGMNHYKTFYEDLTTTN